MQFKLRRVGCNYPSVLQNLMSLYLSINCLVGQTCPLCDADHACRLQCFSASFGVDPTNTTTNTKLGIYIL